MSPAETIEMVRVAPDNLPRYLAPLVARGPHRQRSRTFRILDAIKFPTQCVTVFARDAYLGRYEITLRTPKVLESYAQETPPDDIDGFSLYVLEHGTWDVDLSGPGPVTIRVTQPSYTITNHLTVAVASLEIAYVKIHPSY
jgi:hypothetical protein